MATRRVSPLAVLSPVVAFVLLILLGEAAPALRGVLNLSLPFFGLIGLGFICGRLMTIPEDGLRWMNFFIVYVALPALFFNMVSAAPVDQIANWSFVATTTFSTLVAFGLAWSFAAARARDDLRPAAIQGVAGAYSNIGYMGPGLTLATFGPEATVPTALIIVFDSMLLFTIVPFFMAIAGDVKSRAFGTLVDVLKKVATHPFNVATALGMIATATHVHPPAAVEKMLSFLQNAAAPSALFVMGVTVALRRGSRPGPEVPVLLLIKLVLHPLIVWALLSLVGDFGRVWTFTAVLMAALPPALNLFVLANQYRVYVEGASTIILAGTLVSVATVTTLLYVISTGTIGYRLFH